jgi:hypothetical protein
MVLQMPAPPTGEGRKQFILMIVGGAWSHASGHSLHSFVNINQELKSHPLFHTSLLHQSPRYHFSNTGFYFLGVTQDIFPRRNQHI